MARKESIANDLVPVPFLAEVQRDVVLLLAPFAPYLAHELWEMLGEKGNLLKAPWPKYDAALAKEEEIEIPVQVNGKLRGRIVVPADADGKLCSRTRARGRESKSRYRRQADRQKDLRARQDGESRGEVASVVLQTSSCHSEERSDEEPAVCLRWHRADSSLRSE